ncbi:carboxymuconolactone decarboxylase family protein [Salinadaptatus halalkaliphilus]|uniref:Carboxymuconolactone decarboxylase family protein n=1 Tax=Salinadaptatus halalkaliphilus TaxID=2419781 RepID=A0A4S3TL88_9EURY|nr:carboxymuconolactone decarboxylase family protein [Salinadaptatus halalkaliphilus]THE64924.1 carboxymuconolactone decarboxylase family protein [Salinadaptatus halalkaliphilus]
MSRDSARVPLVTQDELPEDYQYLFDEDVLGELHLFQSMGHVPRAMQAYMRYGTALWNAGDLTTRERELAILAVARTVRARYEWHQHVELGREAGITDSELAAIARDDDTDFPEREQAIMRYASAVATGGVTDPLFRAAEEVTDTETVVGLTMLAGHYLMTARILDSLSVPIDDEAFVGWSPT